MRNDGRKDNKRPERAATAVRTISFSRQFTILSIEYRKGEYDPSISSEMGKNISDTITFKDGHQFKLKAGMYAIIRPDEIHPTFSGYQIHYFCPDGYTKTYG